MDWCSRLADVFALMKLPFDSEEAIQLDSLILSNVLLLYSNKYQFCYGKVLMKLMKCNSGIFQFDMWEFNLLEDTVD